jgi:hypothetical protein
MKASDEKKSKQAGRPNKLDITLRIYSVEGADVISCYPIVRSITRKFLLLIPYLKLSLTVIFNIEVTCQVYE